MRLRVIFILVVIMIIMVGCKSFKHNVGEVSKVVPINEVSNGNAGVIQNDNEVHDVFSNVDKDSIESDEIEENYEEELEKQNEYLVASTLDGTSILINITKALDGETSILEVSQFKSKYLSVEELDNYNFRKISADGLYAYLTYKTGMLNSTEADINKKIIYDLLEGTTLEFELNANVMSDDLSKYYMSGDEIYDVTNDSKLTLKNLHGALSTQIVSKDNKYLVGGQYEGDNCFLIIFDIENDVIIEKKFLGASDREEFRIPIWISQWHSNGDILFNFERYAYKYDFTSKELVNMGKYMFYPFLTHDEKNIVYARLQSDPSEWSVAHLSDYGEIGIYIRNIETGKDTQILKDSDYGTKDMRFEYLITTEVTYEKKQ